MDGTQAARFAYLPYLKELNDETSFRYLVLVDLKAKEKIPNYDFVEMRFERPPMDRICVHKESRS
ncbi:hypothetical protein DRP04_06235 [Archaeoglobales archaeon]|nr:MAG: hypothetical protein DRP04_06235 [Archaeoglobales archaeon]